MRNPKLTQEQKNEIMNKKNLQAMTAREIADSMGVDIKDVYNHLARMKKEKKKSKKKVKSTQATENEYVLSGLELDPNDSLQDLADEEIDYKAWCLHYKGLYLKAHALLIENNIDPNTHSLLEE